MTSTQNSRSRSGVEAFSSSFLSPRSARGPWSSECQMHNKIRSDIALTPEQRNTYSQPNFHHSASSVSMVPSSGFKIPDLPRTAHRDDHDLDENSIPQTGHRQRYQPITSTPVKSVSKFAIPAIPDSAARATERQTLFETPVKTKGVVASTPDQADVFATPILEASGRAETTTGGNIPATPEQKTADKREGANIYDALGWND